MNNKVTQGFYSWYNTHIQNKNGYNMKTELLESGGRIQLAAIHEGDFVYIVGDGYITKWNSLEDFQNTLDGEMVEPLLQHEI